MLLFTKIESAARGNETGHNLPARIKITVMAHTKSACRDARIDSALRLDIPTDEHACASALVWLKSESLRAEHQLIIAKHKQSLLSKAHSARLASMQGS